MSRTAERQFPINDLGPGTPTPLGSARQISDRPVYLEVIGSSEERQEKEWRLKKNVSVSAKGSTGSSSLVNSEAERYHLPKTRVIHVGDKMRKGYQGIAPLDLTLDEHRMMDYGTMLNLLASPHLDSKPVIFDAKLGGVMIHYLRRLSEDHDLPRLIKELDQQHTFDYYPDYAFLRDLEDNQIVLPETSSLLLWGNQVKRLEIAKSKDSTADLTDSQIRRISSKRDRKNDEEWKEAHPWMRDWQNILDRNATDEDGRFIYDRYLNISRLSAEEASLAAHGIFIQEGIVVEKGKRKPPTLLLPNTPYYLNPGESSFA